MIIEKRDQNYHLCGIFVNFAKAFDCVNHRILLDKLEHYGIKGCAYALVRSYLSNRMQYTVNNEQTSSDMLPITIGVRQGGVLRPFLFLVYINDQPRSCNSNVVLYADDTVLLCWDKNVDDLKIKCESKFIKIKDWITSNKLTLNYSKTNCFLMSNENKSQVAKNFCINACNGLVTQQNVVKYLGVHIDKQLTWKNHFKHVIQKLSIARNIISKLRHHALTTALRSVYFFLVYSHFHYGMSTLGNAARKYITKLQVQQNCILTILTKSSFIWTKLLLIYRQKNVIKIPSIYKLEVLKIMHKINTKTLPNCVGDLLQISRRHIVIQFDLPPVIINPYFFLTKLIHNVPFATKVLSFGMRNQMNLKIRLIKPDILS